MHAPALLRYEVANALTRLVAANHFPTERVAAAWEAIMSLPVKYHLLEANGNRVVATALELRRQSAYDAAYIILAQDLGAVLWPFDGPLARNAAGRNYPVQLIE